MRYGAVQGQRGDVGQVMEAIVGARKTGSAEKKSATSGKTAASKSASKKAATFKRGDAVAWQTSQGETQGTVERVVTSPMNVKGHHVAASKENPEVLVTSAKSGKEAVHRPGALKRRK